MKLNNKVWMKVHNYVTVFFLPLALIFIITGMLYLFGIHGTQKEQKIEFQVDSSLLQNTEALTVAVKNKLEENNIKMPEGTATKRRDSFFWGKSTDVSVSLSPDRKSGELQLTVNTPGLYDKLLLAHKGKIGQLFSIFSIIFSISLLITYFSGVFLVLKNSKSRKSSVMIMATGFIAAVALFMLSI